MVMILSLLMVMFSQAGVESLKLVQRAEDTHYVYANLFVNPDQSAQKVDDLAKVVFDFCKKEGLKPEGHRFTKVVETFEKSWHMRVGYAVGVPLKEPKGEYFPGTIPKGEYIRSDYVGPYENTQILIDKISLYVRNNGLEVQDTSYFFFTNYMAKVPKENLQTISWVKVRKKAKE